jgi:hypothetical protein
MMEKVAHAQMDNVIALMKAALIAVALVLVMEDI